MNLRLSYALFQKISEFFSNFKLSLIRLQSPRKLAKNQQLKDIRIKIEFT